MGTRRKYYILHFKNQGAQLTPNATFCSTLSNPTVSEEAKQNAQAMLNEIGGGHPREELFQARGDQNKDPIRVSAGLKA